jgi:energy-coupling factor transporter ATP-binding protein EcfA2
VRRFGLVLTAAVGVCLGLVGNLATNTVSLPDRWHAGIWVVTAMLAAAVIIGTILHPTGFGRRRKAFTVERTRYFTRLLERYQRLDLDSLASHEVDWEGPVPLPSVFVAPHVRAELPRIELPSGIRRHLIEAGEMAADQPPHGTGTARLAHVTEAYARQPIRSALDVLAESGQRRVVLLGDPGSGKSTLVRYVTLALGTRSGHPPAGLMELREHLPLLIELRGFADPRWRGGTFLDYVDHLHVTEGLGLPKDVLEDYLSAGRPAVVVFDGLDEVFEPRLRESIAQQIVAFAGRYTGARVIVTSRVIGYRRMIFEGAGFVHHTLQNLDSDQIEKFADQWYRYAHPGDPAEAARLSRRLLAAVRDSASIRDLAGNPLLLTILAVIGRHQPLPRARREVYQHAVSVLVEHWDVNKHLHRVHPDAPFVGRDDKLELLRAIARRMQNADPGNASNAIPGAELVAEFERYLREKYQITRDRSVPAAETMLTQFRERNFILSRFGGDVYGFVHRAFLEYLSGADIAHRFRVEGEWTSRELASEVFGRHGDDPAWHEILLLLIGMIDARDAAYVIRHLLAADPLWSAAPDDPPHHLILAVRCLGEVDDLDVVASEARAVLNALAAALEVIEDTIDDDPDRDFSEAVLEELRRGVEPVFVNVSHRWPGREHYLAWFDCFEPRTSGRFPDGCSRVRLAGAVFMAHLFADSPAVQERLRAEATFEGDEAIRSHAIEAVAATWHDDPRALAFILRRATDPDTLYIVVTVLGVYWSGNAEALAFIHRVACTDQTWFVREAAVRILAAAWPDDPETLPFVRSRATLDDHWSVRRAALHTLGSTWGTDPQTRVLLRARAVDDTSSTVRMTALRAVAVAGRNDPRTRALLYERASADADATVRSTAVDVLASGWSREPGTVPLLRDLAEADADPAVRFAAARAVAAASHDNRRLLELLHDQIATGAADSHRSRAVQALVDNAHDPSIRQSLRAGIADPDPYLRAAAVRYLASDSREDPDTLPLLCGLAVGDPDPAVRTVALRAVVAGWREHRTVLDSVRKSVTDADPALRRAAIRALATGWRDDPATLRLISGYATTDDDWTVRRTAIRTLATAWGDEPSTITSILSGRAEADPDGRVRRAAIRASARTARRDRPLPAVIARRAANDDDAGVRQAAARAAAAWRHDPQARSLLFTLASEDGCDEVRRTALHVLAVRWPHEPETFGFIRHRGTVDGSEQVRTAVAMLLEVATESVMNHVVETSRAVGRALPSQHR